MIIYKLNTVPQYEQSPVVLHANQFEYGGTWTFKINDGDSTLLMGGSHGAVTVTLNIYKADSNVFSMPIASDVDLETDYLTVTIQQQMVAAAGKAVAEFVFSDGAGIQKATANFIIDVERSPIDMDGVQSESVIDYVEGNRAAAEAATTAAENATAAAQAATTAAGNAAQAATDAAEAAENIVSNIESVPSTLQSLVATLVSTSDPEKFLGFNSSGNAMSLDTGFVTPQMYGAAGDGTTDDTAAFSAAIASGKKVIVPEASYNLTSVLWSDDSVVISDAGTYTNKPLIISKALRNDAPVVRFITEFNASESNIRDYRIQTGCYDSTNQRIVVAYCYKTDSSNVDTDLVLTAYDTDWNPIEGMSKVITNGGHGNSMAYRAINHKIYAVVGNGTLGYQIAVVDPDTLELEEFISPVSGSRCWQLAYDSDNDIFYLHYTKSVNGSSQAYYRAYDSSFNPLDKEFPMNAQGVVDIGKLHYGEDGLYVQGPTVIDGQIIQTMYGTKFGTHIWGSNGAFLVQYNYHDGSIKKVYRVTDAFPADEAQCVINVEGRMYFIVDTSYRDGYRNVGVFQLVFDERLSGNYESPYTDAKLLSADELSSDLDDILTPGWYIATGASVVANLDNAPCSQAFSMYVIPLMVRDARAQVAIANHGEIYVRVFLPSAARWYGWRQLAETPRSGATRAGTWYGAGFITGGGKDIRFTIPMATLTVGSENPAVTVNSLTLIARQDGNYLLNNVEVIGASGYTITANVSTFGVHVIVVADEALANAVNNAAVGIQANISMSFE